MYLFVNANIHKCYAIICSSIWRYFSAISLNLSFVCLRPSCDDMGSWKLIKANVFPTEAKNSSSTWKDFSWPQLRGDVSWREWLWIKDAFLRLSFRIIKKWPKVPPKIPWTSPGFTLMRILIFLCSIIFQRGTNFGGISPSTPEILRVTGPKRLLRSWYQDCKTWVRSGNKQLHRYTPEN